MRELERRIERLELAARHRHTGDPDALRLFWRRLDRIRERLGDHRPPDSELSYAEKCAVADDETRARLLCAWVTHRGTA